MKLRKHLFFSAFLLITASLSGQNDPVITKIIENGRYDNHVMDHIDILTNRIGERLTGSDGYFNACTWAVNTMRSWGMVAEMQEAGVMPVGFNRGYWSGKMISPKEMTLDFGTPSYTAGTKGRQKGKVMIAPKTTEEFWQVRDSIKDSWLLIDGTNTGWPRDMAGVTELTKLIRQAGALGTIQLSTYPIRLLYQKVESWDKLPELPDIKLHEKQFREIKDLVRAGKRVVLEFDIRNYFKPGPVKYYNVIGWIPGCKYPDEYVIVGGHLDGFDGGSGAVDNASGATVAMEVARLILASGGKPDRTIMVQLWAAEEFGLLGSSAWVNQNPDKLPRISAVFNRDGGTNCISGLSVSKAMMADFSKVTAPLKGLNNKYPFELTERSKPLRKGGRGGTDTFSFLQKDVPAFGFSTKGEQMYGMTWHTTLDTYDQIIAPYQEYSAMATAVVAYGIANLDHLLSRDGNMVRDGIYADFNTNKGKFTILLDYKKAPMTVANFIGLTEGTIKNATYPAGVPFYKNSIWHRVVKGHVIQGGEPSVIKDPANTEKSSTGYEIPNEISDLSHNKAGMLGMANAGPNTNTCEYYITLGDRSYLDGNYTLFGEVVEGMDVVNNISQGDTTRSITIIRAGADAEKFVVNDDTFWELTERQWIKVRKQKEEKNQSVERYVNDNYKNLIKMPDGLRYQIMAEGKGVQGADSSVLTVSFRGKLVSGVTFVSSSVNGNPADNTKAEDFTYILGRNYPVKGIAESLKLMKPGEKRLLVIPPDLAYGENSGYYGKMITGKKRLVISPGETLIIELELKRISAVK